MALFDVAEYEDPRFGNPMVQRAGLGPGGKRCSTCRYFVRISSYNRPSIVRYRKCELRGITHGPGTDHKATYHACSAYQPAHEGSE